MPQRQLASLLGTLQGVNCLCKDGKAVEAADRGTALNGFSQFLKSLGPQATQGMTVITFLGVLCPDFP